MKLHLTIFFGCLALLAYQPSAIFAQNTVVSYQGSVHDSGTNFSGTGLFQFALVTSSNANQTATAVAGTPSGGFITTITVTFVGSGYVSPPAVTISGGGGSGATATATITNGSVATITINTGQNGSGYTNTPTVTVAPPLPSLSYTTYWSNDGTSSAGSEPQAGVSVGVTNGLFTVGLGDTTIANMTALSAALFSQPGLQLQIWFNDGVNGFAALSPVQNLTSVPYAAFANTASNLLGNVPAAQVSGMLSSSTLPTNAVFSGTVTATIFSGNGTNLTSLNASNLAGGTVPLSCLSGITSNQLNATTWQLATNLNGGNAALASNVVPGITISNIFVTSSLFAGNGGGLTNLVASQLISIGNTNTGAAGNFFAGPSSGNASMTGDNNTGLGIHALLANTNGTDNAAVGLNALLNNAGGGFNTAIGTYALQANVGGNYNTASGMNALYANITGSLNTASGIYTLYSITNGSDNTANGAYALQTSPSGFGNTAIGCYALNLATTGSNNIALGYQAGQTITAGSSNIDIGNPGFASDANVIRIGTGQTATYLAGNVYAAGAVFSNGLDVVSDRNAKEDFLPLNPQTVLAKVVGLPITEWNYKTAKNLEHIGPMAQDFHAAFGLNGSDDRHIAVVDEGGVALAAIQGLNQKLDDKDAEIQELKTRLDRLERLINAKNEMGK
jgi:hypothetical protein